MRSLNTFNVVQLIAANILFVHFNVAQSATQMGFKGWLHQSIEKFLYKSESESSFKSLTSISSFWIICSVSTSKTLWWVNVVSPFSSCRHVAFCEPKDKNGKFIKTPILQGKIEVKYFLEPNRIIWHNFTADSTVYFLELESNSSAHLWFKDLSNVRVTCESV